MRPPRVICPAPRVASESSQTGIPRACAGAGAMCCRSRFVCCAAAPQYLEDAEPMPMRPHQDKTWAVPATARRPSPSRVVDSGNHKTQAQSHGWAPASARPSAGGDARAVGGAGVGGAAPPLCAEIAVTMNAGCRVGGLLAPSARGLQFLPTRHGTATPGRLGPETRAPRHPAHEWRPPRPARQEGAPFRAGPPIWRLGHACLRGVF